MTKSKSPQPSSHGIVVDHLEAGVRYAISDRNYKPKQHSYVRDLKPGETVRGFRPKPLPEHEQPELDMPQLPDTEGSSTEGTQGNK